MNQENFGFTAGDLFKLQDIIQRVRLPHLWIDGVEVTQGIQYYHAANHLTDAADRGADNSVTLIAGKPAWVRVYVRSGIFPSTPGVTGTIEVIRRSAGFLYATPIATLNPQPPGSVTAHRSPAYATERGTLTDSLNFILNADQMCGFLRLHVKVQTAAGDSDETTIDLNVTLQQTLRIAGILVGYNGPSATATKLNPTPPNLTLAAPTLANLQTTSSWTLLTFPVQSAATYRSAGTITWNKPLDDPRSCDGCCTPNWVALNNAVQAQKVADGNHSDVLYYGLLASGIPTGIIIGCESSGVSSGQNGDVVTMAHELGHACGLSHGPCGTTSGNPNFPAYEPYDATNTPQASIGEYGLNVSNGNIMSPAVFKELMSYCGPRWISLYYYGLLTNNTALDPVRVCVDYPWWKDIVLRERFLFPEKWLPDPPPEPDWRERGVNPEQLISIIGVLYSEDELEISSVMRVEAMRDVRGGRATGMIAELVGADGRVVARGKVQALMSSANCGGGCSGGGEPEYPHTFQAFVPNVEPGALLRIRRGEKEIWSRRASASEPKIGGFEVSLCKTRSKKGAPETSQIELEWEVRAESDAETECWVQWSKDRKTWRALTTGLRGKSATIDASGLPSGRISVRLLASDGFHTAESKHVAVEIPKRAPSPAILTPSEGQTLIAGNPMRLWGAGTMGGGESASEEKAVWLLDGKEFARGLDAFATAPGSGEHRLTLVIEDDGERGEATVKFRVVKLPRSREDG